MNIKSEKGAVIVEAVIYYPIVICVIVFLIYLGLFHIQSAAIDYEVRQAAVFVSKDISNPGYSSFHSSVGVGGEFQWSGDTPSSAEVEGYYAAYDGSASDGRHRLSSLYREITHLFKDYESDYGTIVGEMINNGVLFRFFVEPDIEVKNTLLGTTVRVTAKYSLPTPGAIRYLGVGDSVTVFQSGAYAHALNPTDFVRNTDLAVDIVEFIGEKLGLDGKIDAFLGKAKKVINILF